MYINIRNSYHGYCRDDGYSAALYDDDGELVPTNGGGSKTDDGDGDDDDGDARRQLHHKSPSHKPSHSPTIDKVKIFDLWAGNKPAYEYTINPEGCDDDAQDGCIYEDDLFADKVRICPT